MTLNTPRVRTLQDLRDFTAGSESFDLKPVSRYEAYHFIETLYQQFGYPHLGKADKGLTNGDFQGKPKLPPFPRTTAVTRPSGSMRTFDKHSHSRHAHPPAFRLISLLE